MAFCCHASTRKLAAPVAAEVRIHASQPAASDDTHAGRHADALLRHCVRL
jgi:hypothetical protein